MSDNYGNTRGYSTTGDSREHSYGYDPSDQKCVSIDDRLDSGIASMTLSDAERERHLNEKIGETTTQKSMGHDDDDGLGKSIQTDVENSVSIDDGFASMPEKPSTEEDTFEKLYAPYLPVTEYGISLLHHAILEKNTNEAIRLISNCPEPACLDCFTSEIHTSLHLAVYRNLPEIVRFLIVYGANFNATDKRGNTPLHTASELGRLSCIRMIVAPLEQTEAIGVQNRKVPQDINQKNYEGLTPLHLATINNHPKVVEFLVQQPGIEVNIPDTTCGRTALHHALERRHRDCFENLLKSAVNINATTYDGCSPLHLAVGLELEQETRSLMTRGANVHIATSDSVKAPDLARTQKIKDALQYSVMQMQNFAVKQR